MKIQFWNVPQESVTYFISNIVKFSKFVNKMK